MDCLPHVDEVLRQGHGLAVPGDGDGPGSTTHIQVIYSWCHKNGCFSVRSFNQHYLSIPQYNYTGSWKHRFWVSYGFKISMFENPFVKSNFWNSFYFLFFFNKSAVLYKKRKLRNVCLPNITEITVQTIFFNIIL